MPDSRFDREATAHKPLPQCKAFLICEEVAADRTTGQINIFKLIDSLSFSKFPARTSPLAAFLQLYDGIGRYELSIELRNLADESSVAEKISRLEFPERLVKMDVVLPIDSIRLPRPGRYEIAILLDGIEAATQFIDVEVHDAGETQEEE